VLITIWAGPAVRANMRTVHLGADECHEHMRRAAHDVIASHLVERAQRLQTEVDDARRDVRTPLIRACAALLDERTLRRRGDRAPLHRRIRI